MIGADTRLALDPVAQNLLFRQAHTAYAFTDDPVSDETVEEIYDLVKYGPTAFNQQPLRALLLRSPESRARLLPHLSSSNRDKTERAPLTAVLAVDHEFHQELPEQFPVLPAAKDLFYADREVREHSAAVNGALQAAYFIIGIRAAGLAAGPMTGFDAAGVDAEFFADGEHSVLAVVNIGRPKPDGLRQRGPRLAYHQVFSSL
ncbi:malonic semialdehyde reductase [Streptomyces sp. FXJ1.4098]|uniref:malonic semialdehyde reductase n=1 Tax=Streptomyces sp. NPDC020845 TaxID=3365096 RepID=UPI00299BDF9E|nr:malonic semialdehyde reductase [Streptomyces sp. FXJ1.4098]